MTIKKIGGGWQYSVYDLGNGRVFKKFHSLPRSYRAILKGIFPFRYHSPLVVPRFSRSMKEKALISFEILDRGKIPLDWVGNPVFSNTLDFEQDKATPLGDVFSSSNISENKKIVDAFVAFNKKLLERGVIDKSLNITKNYGLSNKGEVVLIDIGELLEDTEKIKNQCEKRIWTKHYVAECIENKEVRGYFISEMDKAFLIKS